MVEKEARLTKEGEQIRDFIYCGVREKRLDGAREIAIFLVCNARQYARR